MRTRQPALVAHGLVLARPARRPPVRHRVRILVQPESVLQNQVERLAALYGWRPYHTHDSRHSPPGFPDLVLVRGTRLIFAELKTQRGRLTLAQSEWLEDLRETWAEVYVWRPADLPIIAAILRRRTRD
jgi:hypothetical protein